MAVLEREVKDLKRTIGRHEFNRKVSQSESLKAQKERERQHLRDQPLLSQRRVRKLTWASLSQSLGGGIYPSALRRLRDLKMVT